MGAGYSSNQKQADLLYDDCIDEFQFNFTPKNVLHLWLVGILPGRHSSLISLNLENNKIRGPKKVCEDKILECKKHIQSTKLQSVTNKQLDQHAARMLQQKFGVKLFYKAAIQKASFQIMIDYHLHELQEDIKELFTKKSPCLISIKLQSVESFQKHIAAMEDQPQSVHGKQTFEEAEVSVISNPNRKGGEKIEVIFEEEYPAKSIDAEQMQSWIASSKVLELKEFDFMSDARSLRVRLRADKFQLEKLNEIKAYLAFSKVIVLEVENKECLEKVEQRFCNNNTKELHCQIVVGYREPSTSAKKLRALIATNQIGKSSRNTEQFAAIWIEGVKPLVQKLEIQINEFIAKMLHENSVFSISFSAGHLKGYILNKQVQQLIKSVVDQLPQEYPQIVSYSLSFTQQLVLLKVEIAFDKKVAFQMRSKERLKLKLEEQIICEQIMDAEDLNTNLEQTYILLHSLTRKGKIVLIEKKKQGLASIKSILGEIALSKTQIIEKSICLKRKMILEANEYLAKLQQDPTTEVMVKSVKIEKNFSDNKISIMGTREKVNKIHRLIVEHIQEVSIFFLEKIFYVSDHEAAIIEKSEKTYLKDLEEAYDVSICLRKNHIGAIITLGKEKFINPEASLVILVEKQRSLSKIPKGSIFIFRSQEDLNFSSETSSMACELQLKKNSGQEIITWKYPKRGFVCYYSEGFENISKFASHIMEKLKEPHSNRVKNLIFFMPKNSKADFVMSLVYFYQAFIEQNNSIKIYILENPQQDLQKSLAIEPIINDKKRKQIKYYVSDNGTKRHYSVAGNKKIEAAKLENEKRCYLENDDLNLSSITHHCSLFQQLMIHKQSQRKTKLKIEPNRISFDLQGREYTLPKREEVRLRNQGSFNAWVDISVGVYEVNLQTNEQINLFSGFRRPLNFDLEELKFNLSISYDFKVNQVEIIYKNKKNVIQVQKKMKQLFEKNKISVTQKLERKISKTEFLYIQEVGLQSNVQVEHVDEDEIVLKSHDTGYINNIKKVVEHILKPSNSEVDYPNTWQPQQKQVQVFEVDTNSAEFQKVQAEFKISPIKKLIRIQNKLVFKKYLDEKNSLRELNNGMEIKQLMLYHGTRKTQPKQIYEDKQECFNINYTREANSLGKGTYFAESSSYSHNFSYSSENYRSMLYCSVLVGDSQIIPHANAQSIKMIDTNYKNEKQRIRFESSKTFFLGTAIYAVYKNRRAYPNYQINY